jgi:hypothetical protein
VINGTLVAIDQRWVNAGAAITRGVEWAPCAPTAMLERHLDRRHRRFVAC